MMFHLWRCFMCRSLIWKLIIFYFLCRKALMLLIVFLITEFHISKTLTTVDQIIPWDGSSTRSLLAKGSTGRGDENLLSLLCAEEAFLDNLIWPGALPAPVDNDRHCCVIYRIWQTPWGIFYPWSIIEMRGARQLFVVYLHLHIFYLSRKSESHAEDARRCQHDRQPVNSVPFDVASYHPLQTVQTVGESKME